MSFWTKIRDFVIHPDEALKDVLKESEKAVKTATRVAGNVVAETGRGLSYIPGFSPLGTVAKGVGEFTKGVGEVVAGGNAARIRNLPQNVGRGLQRDVGLGKDGLGGALSGIVKGGNYGDVNTPATPETYTANEEQTQEVAKENIKNTTGATLAAFRANKLRRNVGAFGFSSNIKNTGQAKAFGSDLSDYFGEV